MMRIKSAVHSYKLVILLIAVVIANGIILFNFAGGEAEEFQLVPRSRATGVVASEVPGIEVVTGWSVRGNPIEAVRE